MRFFIIAIAMSCCISTIASPLIEVKDLDSDDSVINLENPGDFHIFPNTLCSEVDLSRITVEGKAFNPDHDRLSIYGNGAIVIADGLTDPLIIYSESECHGSSMILLQDRYYRSEMQENESFLPEESIGEFDNHIRSFRLKKGFSCTMANNPDGTGYSRVFIADDEDLIINSMPDGLDFVSFVRVCRHDWVGKRGMSGFEPTVITRSSWFYDWGAGANSASDYEYVPMRHNQWWDGWDNINSRINTASLLGFNEPDHADQSDLSPDIAIDMWPEFMKSGLRIGSPAPDNINGWWLAEFLEKADSLNYRVDFVATHMYWNSQDPYRLAETIADLCKNKYGGRPMWITEWNNGANWTHENWPDQKGPQRDADFNIIYNADGSTTEVSRPHTEANSAKQCEWLEKALDAFDNCDWLERHAFYNWVEDARSVMLGDRLTPAGQIFASFDSRSAFNRQTEYIHEWRIAPPRIIGISRNSKRVRINFYDHNGETADHYTIERRINGGDWEEIASIYPGQDYKLGQETFFLDNNYHIGLNEYRFKAISYKDTESIWSRVVGVNVKDSALDIVNSESGLEISVEDGQLVIDAECEGTLPLYSVDGRLIKIISYPCGLSHHSLPLHGLYFLGSKKIIV